MGYSIIKKSKKWMIIAVAFLLLLFSVLSIVIVFNKNRSNSVDAAYRFNSRSTSEPSKDTLNAYSSYTISSASGFKKWRWAMNKYGSDVFNGKTTTLSTDITFNSSTLERDGSDYAYYNMPNNSSTTYHMKNQTGDFYGTLDGQGHKISGCTVVTGDSCFFDEIYGTIKNIHFYNIDYICTEWRNRNRGLIGYEVMSGSSIINCIIEDVYCENGAYPIEIITNTISFGPIAAKNSGTIYACLVRGSYSVSGHTQSNILGITGNRQVYAYAMTVEGGVENCIFDATYSHGGWDSGSENRTGQQTGTNYYGSYASAKQNANSLDSSYWHVPPTNEYNSGNPMLSSFISWYSVRVYPNNSSYGSTSKSSISLPSGGSYSPTISSNNLTLYGNPVTANAKTGYEFVAWSVNLSSRNIVANFDLKKYWVNVNIYNPANQEDYVTAKMTITYSYGNKVYSDMTNEPGNPAYNVPAGSTITISNIQIIMANPEIYYISEIKDGNGNSVQYTGNYEYTVNTNDSQSINIYIRLKEYSVVFE